ncbi:SHOCT domain-containing protein [Embleya hyalina]|uniref:Membrane protein n=1 Tax=Embleya hyalina TaxID=516124 RepID=A0A401Z1J2_9ACTN|nr:SHOCT domain-containing protein [Embleya hyalina]GCE00744.1 membrane protein [Embleya hyalina]
MDYPLLNAFWTMFWFFLWILWIMLLFHVFGDIIRDDSLSGWAKAGWSIVCVILPFLGIFVYLIVRGHGMGERDRRRAERQQQEFRSYVRDAAATPATSEELARIAELRNDGDITVEEYERAKAKILA